MGKRLREDDELAVAKSAKRARPATIDRLSGLSDELILRILSQLSVAELAVCQRLSHKYSHLASDSQIWKSLYYIRFVRPRASRLPGLRDLDNPSGSLHFASKASRWLDEDHLVQRGRETNWKREYKLRHNWARGACAVKEIPVAGQAPVPPVLVHMHDSVIYVADRENGVRAWSVREGRRLIATVDLEGEHGPPASIAVDSQGGEKGVARVVIGFEDGAFALYLLRPKERHFVHGYTHEASMNGMISAVAVAFPYVVTMTATQLLSLYRFAGKATQETVATLQAPRLLHSLKSHTVWPPLSVSVRPSESNVMISIAYTLPTYLSGWTVGIQEIRVSPDGKLQSSRLASAIDQHYRPLAFSSIPTMHHLTPRAPGSLATATTTELRHIHSKPTSLSYTHPYLLVSHPDNTLILYLVTSTADALTISAGSRLWGHTSSVSGAHVGGRGKAVSVSRRGDELRVWELEGGFATAAAKRRLASGDLSVQLRPERRSDGAVSTPSPGQSGLDLVSISADQNKRPGPRARRRGTEDANAGANADGDVAELTLTRGWIGFDEENVVVLKEASHGTQALMVYDFT